MVTPWLPALVNFSSLSHRRGRKALARSLGPDVLTGLSGFSSMDRDPWGLEVLLAVAGGCRARDQCTSPLHLSPQAQPHASL